MTFTIPDITTGKRVTATTGSILMEEAP